MDEKARGLDRVKTLDALGCRKTGEPYNPNDPDAAVALRPMTPARSSSRARRLSSEETIAHAVSVFSNILSGASE